MFKCLFLYLNREIDILLSEWAEEIKESLVKSNALCIALFGPDKQLLFATPVMKSLFKGDPYKSFINPTFDKLLIGKSDASLIFEGFMTIGDYASVNSSILARVYSKEGKLLIIGGVDTTQLIEQNISILNLNHQINNLQRQLIKEKLILENTLKQLDEANYALKQAIAVKDRFFSIIAHDLKNPFNAIIGFSDLLLEQIRNNDFEGIDKYAQIILESSRSAMELLTNLMEWSRLQTGRIEFRPEYFNISTALDETILLIKGSAEQKSISIINNLSPGLFVYADKVMVGTVLRNLISNAIKFTYPGGKVTVASFIKEDEIIISVADTGVGIPEERIGRLFEIGEAYSTRGTQNEKGTGLGLILCKEFIEKNNGRIWVESTPGAGTTFYFSIPYVGKNK